MHHTMIKADARPPEMTREATRHNHSEEQKRPPSDPTVSVVRESFDFSIDAAQSQSRLMEKPLYFIKPEILDKV